MVYLVIQGPEVSTSIRLLAMRLGYKDFNLAFDIRINTVE